MKTLPFQWRFLLLTLALLLAGCSGLMLTHAEATRDMEQVPAGVELTQGAVPSSTGCELRYRLYRPEPERLSPQHDGTLVVLGHGFLRSQQRMSGLAEAIATAGTPVATLDFCNMRVWDGRHQQNGLDMIALARQLDASRVIYAGFSAGGLAAVVAGRNDPMALGVVTLDLVEADGIGVHAASGLDIPLLGLAGEPTNCNARGNGRAVFAASARGRVDKIAGAGHCDFESPSDALCELLCQDPSGDTDGNKAAMRDAIIAGAVGAIETLREAPAPSEIRGRNT